MRYTIIGGGIIGLCTAYYLRESGALVTVIDQSDLQDGCSFGNAGMIVPSHFVPLASPGIISKGIRWMFDAKSPFYIKPRLSWPLLQWLWAFYRSCTPAKVEKAAPLLRDLSWFSQQLFRELAQHPALDFAYQEKGLLMLYQSAKAEKEETEMAERANALGVKAQVLNPAALAQLETKATLQVRGGVYYPGDAHLTPHQLMAQLITYLKRKGVTFMDRTTVTGFSTEGHRIKALYTAPGAMLPLEQLIIAGGSWTPALLRQLQIPMLLQDGKGYSITASDLAENLVIPSILTEAKVALTPMGNTLRIGGTLEISNLSSQINTKRVQGILEAVPKYYPNLHPALPPVESIWHGFRPCTPDGLPYIGMSKKWRNLTIACGHAMMGLSLGPGTGKLVSELVLGQAPSMDLSLFRPERFH